MTRRWSAQALALFDTASRLPAEEREAYLEEACADDAGLMTEVRALLTAGEALPPGADSGSLDAPERIGPYRILRVLGEGGMGVVYEAEQTEPVSRRVALKMMKVGMDTVEVVRRFESERQALAVMDHPGIAKVFDAGATRAGRPYFVMELVDGVRLDEFCDAERLTTKERVELFSAICEAVQHAHLKGVIHRDLKPSNVLVTKVDGRPLPKVIDFGVAKATGQKLTHETVVTTYGQAIGTLAYMSPEQAESADLDVDTRSDVYSLGVVLYELLLGVVPLDPKEMGAWPFVAQLVERDVPMPSPVRRLTALSERERDEIAERRRTDARRLRTELGSDLQSVVLKALEKDRDRRYDTAEGLAADLRRCLAHEPVTAHPPSPGYRFRKFVRRNRTVAAMAAVLAALSLFYAGSMAVQLRLVAQERDRAESEAETSRRVSDFMTELFSVSNPNEARGRTITAREILERGTERIETELADEPVIQHKLLTVMGEVHTRLGLYDEADRLLMAGLDAARRGSVTPDSTVASSLNQLAYLYRLQGRGEEGLPLAQAASELAADVWGTDSRQYGMVEQNLGVIERDRGNYEEARIHLEASVALLRANLGPEHPDAGWPLYHLGWLTYLEGDFYGARDIYQEVIDLFEASFDEDDPNRAVPYNDMAIVLRELGELDESLAMHERILELRERVYGPDHPLVAGTLANMANVLNQMGESERALERQERALDIREQTYGHEHPQVAGTLNNLGLTLHGLGRYREAAEQYEEAIRIQEAVGDPSGSGLRRPLNNLGYLLRYTGHPERARPLLLRSLALGEEILGAEHPDLTFALVNLAFIEVDAGRYQTAMEFLQRAVAITESAFGTGHANVAEHLLYLGANHNLAGHPDLAREVLQRSLTIFEEADAPASESVAAVCWELGKAFDALGDPVTADSLFARSLGLAREAGGVDGTMQARFQLRYSAYEGDVDRALDQLESLIDSGYRDAWVFREPELTGLWEHPRFQELTREIRQATAF